jgi:hypothetical protein
MTFHTCSSRTPTPVKPQPAPAIHSKESVHTTLSITHHTRKRPSTGPRSTHGPHSRGACGQCVSRRDYSSSGLHQLYCAYAVHSDASSRGSTSHQSVALALAVHPVTASRDVTTHHPTCTGPIAPMSCIRTRRLAARLLVGQSHWLSLCVWSLHLAARLLMVRLAPALLRQCRASGRAVSTLDFSSVGRTGSRRVPGLITRLAAATDILRLRHASGCLGTSRGSSSTTSPRAGLSSTTSPTPCVRLFWHVARLVP